MVVFDAGFLLLLLRPGVPAPNDPATGQPVTRAKARIERLIGELDRRKEKIIVPTPALAELLVRAGSAGPAYRAQLSGSGNFKVVAFDERAAIEVAAALHDAISSGDRRSGAGSPWAKVKFDWQIVAIGKVEGASIIYTTDGDVVSYARRSAIPVVQLHELPLPDEDLQRGLFDEQQDDE